MQQSVADGIGEGRVADVGVPVFDGALAGYDGGARPGPVLDELSQIPPFDICQLGKQEVIDD